MRGLQLLVLVLASYAGTMVGAETIEFEGEDIASVLKQLGQKAGLRVVVDHSVVGTVTMRLEESTAKEAMDRVIQANGLRTFEVKGVLAIDNPEADGKPAEKKESKEEGVDGFVQAISSSVQRAARDPAVAESLAEFHWNYFRALKKRGFTDEQAMRIVAGHQVPVDFPAK